jgi:hypothetical protein
VVKIKLRRLRMSIETVIEGAVKTVETVAEAVVADVKAEVAKVEVLVKQV